MAVEKSEILQGTLDLMVLKALEAMGPLHGYGVARRIEQISEEALQGWISGEWGTSNTNRKAKFYSITKAGRKQLNTEARNWERISNVIGRVVRIAERG